MGEKSATESPIEAKSESPAVANHTPGPWRESWDYKRLGPSSARMVAHAVGPQHSCIGVSIDDSPILQPDRATMERVFADARLIAAAPDMLAALRGALVVLESMPRPTAGLVSNEVQKAFDRRHEAVRAAIAKAERV